jgi:hypothetical protein
MIDTTALRLEVAQARAARLQAEDACCDVEELLWDVERGPRTWRRLAQVDAPEPVELTQVADTSEPPPLPLAA